MIGISQSRVSQILKLVDLGPEIQEAVLLGNVALRPELKEIGNRNKLMWDPEKFEITNMPEANQFLRREYRKGWSL